MTVLEVFEAAVDVPEAEREAFLQRACGGDESLLRKVKALLKAHNRTGHFLDRSPACERPEGGPVAPIGERAGDQIGPYKLLQQIGEGGCGVVFMAEQEAPVRRRVALKVVKPGMDSKNVIARFEVERQALALMEHPNSAHVFDAGTTASGRPYFVMELIRGIKITDFCDQNSLTTIQRLELFTEVCNALQHAHQKGIIHRDIKPSNISVFFDHSTDKRWKNIVHTGYDVSCKKHRQYKAISFVSNGLRERVESGDMEFLPLQAADMVAYRLRQQLEKLVTLDFGPDWHKLDNILFKSHNESKYAANKDRLDAALRRVFEVPESVTYEQAIESIAEASRKQI